MKFFFAQMRDKIHVSFLTDDRLGAPRVSLLSCKRLSPVLTNRRCLGEKHRELNYTARKTLAMPVEIVGRISEKLPSRSRDRLKSLTLRKWGISNPDGESRRSSSGPMVGDGDDGRQGRL